MRAVQVSVRIREVGSIQEETYIVLGNDLVDSAQFVRNAVERDWRVVEITGAELLGNVLPRSGLRQYDNRSIW